MPGNDWPLNSKPEDHEGFHSVNVQSQGHTSHCTAAERPWAVCGSVEPALPVSLPTCSTMQKMWASSCWKRLTRVKPLKVPDSSFLWRTPKSANRTGISLQDRGRCANIRLDKTWDQTGFTWWRENWSSNTMKLSLKMYKCLVLSLPSTGNFFSYDYFFIYRLGPEIEPHASHTNSMPYTWLTTLASSRKDQLRAAITATLRKKNPVHAVSSWNAAPASPSESLLIRTLWILL